MKALKKMVIKFFITTYIYRYSRQAMFDFLKFIKEKRKIFEVLVKDILLL